MQKGRNARIKLKDDFVKIWDNRKLEKDISFRSRLTYSPEGCRALCATMLRGTTQVVVGASDGMIHLFSIDYISRGFSNVIEKYSGIADIQNRTIGEGAILSVLNCSSADSCISQTVLFTSQHCGVHLWDTRAKSDAWTFKALHNLMPGQLKLFQILHKGLSCGGTMLTNSTIELSGCCVMAISLCYFWK